MKTLVFWTLNFEILRSIKIGRLRLFDSWYLKKVTTPMAWVESIVGPAFHAGFDERLLTNLQTKSPHTPRVGKLIGWTHLVGNDYSCKSSVSTVNNPQMRA